MWAVVKFVSGGGMRIRAFRAFIPARERPTYKKARMHADRQHVMNLTRNGQYLWQHE